MQRAQSAWILLLSAFLLTFGTAVASSVTEESFEDIKNSPVEQAVLFYHGSDSKCKDAVKTFKKVAKEIREQLPHFKFKKCDCELGINKKECDEAQFTSGYYVFTQTPNEGIVKYAYPLSVANLAAHIKHKYLPLNENDVEEFTTEDELYEHLDNEEDARPVFIKFYEKWCEHCKRLAKPFNQAATYFKDSVMFMEVECSRNEDTTEFCTKNEVRNYPVLMLFTGEDKITFKEEMRSVLTFQTFFEKHIPDFDAGAPPVKASNTKATKTKGKKKAKRREDDDEAGSEEEEIVIKRKDPKAKKSEVVEAEVTNEAVNNVGSFAKKKKAPAAEAGGSTLEARVASLEQLVQDLVKELRELRERS